MLAHLLESKTERNRSVWGALVSTVAHTIAIGVAVFATAQARVDEPRDVEVVRWMNPPAARPPAAAAPVRSVERPALAALPDLRLLERIDVVTPPVDLMPAQPSLNSVPFTAGAATSGLTSDHTGRVEITEPLSADQVERQVYLRPGSSPPRYPDALVACASRAPTTRSSRPPYATPSAPCSSSLRKSGEGRSGRWSRCLSFSGFPDSSAHLARISLILNLDPIP